MLRVLTALFACAVAQAATSSANLSVTATLTTTATGYSASGTATITGGISASGTFNATLATTTLATGGSSPYTITTSSGTLAGSITIPFSVLTAILSGSTSASGASATITSATGSYAGDTGSFPNLSGSGGVGAGGISVSFSGAGTVTTGGTTTNPAPTITSVENDATNDFGTPGTIAQGSLFVVKGSTMSASGYVQTSLPYPTSSGTTSISFTPTAGGSATAPYIFYTYNVSGVNQIGAILPSTLATGNYNVTVTYSNQTSAAFPVTVVKASPGIFTQDTSGSGLGVVQNIISATQYDVDRLTTGTVGGYTVSPAKPGQTIIVWATGLGPVSGYADNVVPPGAFNYPGVQVVIGGTSITPLYAGASGYPGLDQINVTLPSNITTGCTVSLQVSVNGTLSAPSVIAIAPDAGSNACVAPGFTTSQLQSLDQGGTMTFGSFQISQIQETVPTVGSVKLDSASGAFTSINAFQLSGAPINPTSLTQGTCTVTTTTVHGNVIASGGGVNLDAGAVTLSGPAATKLNNTVLSESGNAYSLTIGTEGITLPGGLNGTITAGSYTLTGPGGKDVGKFNASLTLGTPLNLTTQIQSTIPRNSPLVLAWTGGNATDPVLIIGYSGTTTGSGANTTTTATEFICNTTAGTGGFTVPVSILSQLPATAAATAGGAGFLEVASGPAPVTFNAPLTAGGSVTAYFSGIIGIGSTVTYQ